MAQQRIRRRTLLAGAAAGAAAMTGVAAGVLPGTANAARPQTWPLRVVTFNIQHGRGVVDGEVDLERQAQTIEDMDADVVALQEVDRHWSERSDFVDQPSWFSERLDMHVVYGANLDRDPLEPGQPRRQYGTAILSRYPILSWRNTHLPMFEGSEQRGLLEARIRFRTTTIVVANTHLQHTDSEERQVQAERIIELLGSDPTKTFLVGDINAIPGTPEVETLTDVFVDAWEVVGEGDGYTIPPVNPNRRIDYIFGSPDVTPTYAEVLDTLVSDHLPVIADYDVPRR